MRISDENTPQKEDGQWRQCCLEAVACAFSRSLFLDVCVCVWVSLTLFFLSSAGVAGHSVSHFFRPCAGGASYHTCAVRELTLVTVLAEAATLLTECSAARTVSLYTHAHTHTHTHTRTHTHTHIHTHNYIHFYLSSANSRPHNPAHRLLPPFFFTRSLSLSSPLPSSLLPSLIS